ncbi:hypothetical protein CRV134 [Nile crocodilepox virus]|uniref:Uncharacterized protein n=1 Tax=Nile crocodilepox virus (isolate Crocodylus niloticus/Zimbabwe/Ume/2001) TaxID=1289473 RepID=Q070B7_CPRVZ|nr:hypothetical protein CRV134 [Nile crocodilepox virus]ABJ09025.1 hypothetical protein CRV134 [Nile crocodilepox virus]
MTLGLDAPASSRRAGAFASSERDGSDAAIAEQVSRIAVGIVPIVFSLFSSLWQDVVAAVEETESAAGRSAEPPRLDARAEAASARAAGHVDRLFRFLVGEVATCHASLRRRAGTRAAAPTPSRETAI